MTCQPNSRQHWILPTALVCVLLIRLVTLGAYPLTDTTEARYGEIARKMVELNDWVTPWFDYGVPFWGKPPLAFWLSAASAKLFGISEFALRLPSFVLSVGMLALVFGMARRQRDLTHAWVSVLVLASGMLFFIASGAVVTDTALSATVTLAMAAFWRGVAEPDTHASLWRYVLFVALGLGLLTKGPITLVLVGLPIVVWAVLSRRLGDSIRMLPWVSGLTLLLLIAAPWYVLAELSTPGFLNYFLIGENFQRFIDPNWTGDLYGNVHTQPKGYIWLLWFGATLPWSALLVVSLLGSVARRGVRLSASLDVARGSAWIRYLLCFALAPGIVFTFAGSVLHTYLLPGMPALALLVAEGWLAHDRSAGLKRVAAMAMILPVSLAVALPFHTDDFFEDKSQSVLLSYLPAGASVIYYGKRPFSGQFYSQGRAREAANAIALNEQLAANPTAYIVTSAKLTLPAELNSRYRMIASAGERRKTSLWSPRRTGH